MTVDLPILMYHSVTDGPAAATRQLSVRPADLARQLRPLRENGSPGSPSATCGAGSESGAAAAGPADRDHLRRRLRRHARAGPAAARRARLPGDRVRDHGLAARRRAARGRAAAGPHDELEPGQELAGRGHRDRRAQPQPPPARSAARQALRAELRVSKALLEDSIGRPVTSMAYPFGYSSGRVRDEVASAGYQQAAGVGNAAARAGGGNHFAVPRMTVGRSTSMTTFAKLAARQQLGWVYATDRALTRGWWCVRRARSVASRIGQRACIAPQLTLTRPRSGAERLDTAVAGGPVDGVRERRRSPVPRRPERCGRRCAPDDRGGPVVARVPAAPVARDDGHRAGLDPAPAGVDRRTCSWPRPSASRCAAGGPRPSWPRSRPPCWSCTGWVSWPSPRCGSRWHGGTSGSPTSSGPAGSWIPTLDAYQSWPGFFAFIAFLWQATGLTDPSPVVAWTPVFYNLLYLPRSSPSAASVTGNRTVTWLAAWLVHGQQLDRPGLLLAAGLVPVHLPRRHGRADRMVSHPARALAGTAEPARQPALESRPLAPPRDADRPGSGRSRRHHRAADRTPGDRSAAGRHDDQQPPAHAVRSHLRARGTWSWWAGAASDCCR